MIGCNLPLTRRVLGNAWFSLPPSLRAMHDVHSELTAEGIATVERGSGLLAQLVAGFMRFPAAGEGIPLRVEFRVKNGKEIWRRTFAEKSFVSIQEAGTGRFDHLLCERFGPIKVGLALVVDNKRLRLVVRGWSLFGIPLPAFSAPSGDTYEFEEEGRFNFHAEIAHPVTGLIVRYHGWLKPRAN